MRHKRILDVARQNPDASVDDLASMVPSATPDLVEHVFEEHGDPAADADGSDVSAADGTDDSDGTDDGGTPAAADDSPTDTASGGDPEPSDLSAKQRDVLAMVAADPTATQQEIGERVGVSRATVNKRVNAIEGFEWSDRESFVDAVFDEPPSPSVTTDGGSTAETPPDDTSETTPSEVEDDDPSPAAAEIATALEALTERVTALEAAREEGTAEAVFDDPELVHKVVHACMDTETISEDEELRILKALLD